MNIIEVRATYLKFCNETGTDPRKAILSAGAALVMFHCRDEAEDLDLDVPQAVYDRFKTEENVRRSSLGEYVDYNEKVSLHVKEHENHPSSITGFRSLGDGQQVFCVSFDKLIEQKITLLEMPDRKPAKIPQDLEDMSGLLTLLAASHRWDSEEGKELRQRAGAAIQTRFDLSQSET